MSSKNYKSLFALIINLLILPQAICEDDDSQKQCHPTLPRKFIGTFVLEAERDSNYEKYLEARNFTPSMIQIVMSSPVTKIIREAQSGMPNRYDMLTLNGHENVVFESWALNETFVVVARNSTKYEVTFALEESRNLLEKRKNRETQVEEVIEHSIKTGGDYLMTKVSYNGVEGNRKYKRQKEACSKFDLPEKFLGTFKLDSNKDENYENHLRARGFNDQMIKLIKSQMDTKVIRKAESGKPDRYDMLKLTSMMNVTFKDWSLGEMFSGRALDGTPLLVIFTLAEGNVLVETRYQTSKPYGKDVILYTTEVKDGTTYLVLENSYTKGLENGSTEVEKVKRYYKKEEKSF